MRPANQANGEGGEGGDCSSRLRSAEARLRLGRRRPGADGAGTPLGPRDKAGGRERQIACSLVVNGAVRYHGVQQ